MSSKNVLTRSSRKRADALLAEGRLPEAAELYRKICRSDKRNTDARVMYAVAQLRRDNLEDAECSCLNALKIDRNHALAHHVLGSVLERQDRLSEAITEFRQAISLRPGFANAHLFLANALARQGENREAENGYLKALSLEKGFVPAMAGLGLLYNNIGQSGAAEKWLKEALAIEPGNTEILIHLGQALAFQGRDGEALRVLEQAIQSDPDSYGANYTLGNIFTRMGRYDDALECYRKADRIRPNDEYAIGAQAHVLERRGQLDDALGLLEPFIASGSTHEGIVLPFAELSMQRDNDDEAIHLLEQALSSNTTGQQTRIEIHYKLGKLLDRAGDYDRSFEHYRKANELTCHAVGQVKGVDTIERQAERVVRRMETCDRAFWHALARAGNCSEKPVFVVGMPRSGTTLVEQILASHPRVYGAGELTAVEEIARLLFPGARYQSSYPDGLAGLTGQVLERHAVRHLRQLQLLSDTASRVVDKCPHNFMHLGLISLLFPNAHIVHIAREPLDTCTSIYFQLFTPQHAYACDLARLGQYYGLYRKLMEYWNRVLSIPILNIRYEQLVAEPEQVTRSLVEFCGLDWDDRCLEFYATKRDVNTPSYGQVRQPIYTKSVSRWKHYQAHLRPLMKALDTLPPYD